MLWHYIENGQQAGPVDDATLRSMISTGKIKADTPVWREGMPDWAPYGNAVAVPSAGGAGGGTQCAECGNYFGAEDLVQIGDRDVCATCKPIVVQKIKEGALQPLHVELRYTGFWMRVVAAVVDWLARLPLTIPLAFLAGGGFQTVIHPGALRGVNAYSGLSYLVNFAYSVFFIGKFGSTLGMMACGIKVVRSNGERISYLRAVGRFFAHLLGVFVGLFIGGVIGGIFAAIFFRHAAGTPEGVAAITSFVVLFVSCGVLLPFLIIVFDKQKRALHDYVCDTRVVYKR